MTTQTRAQPAPGAEAQDASEQKLAISEGDAAPVAEAPPETEQAEAPSPKVAAPEAVVPPVVLPAQAEPLSSVPPPLTAPQPSVRDLDDALAALARQGQERERFSIERETTEAQLADAREQLAVQQYRSQLEANYPGVDTTALVQQYQGMLAQERTRLRQERANQYRAEIMQFNQQAKEIYGRKWSAEFGMPYAEIMAFDDPKVMRAEARAWKAETRAKKAEGELAAFKLAQVGPQTPTNSTTSRVRVPATSANIDKLYMDFEREHPGERNPYEAQYRTIIG